MTKTGLISDFPLVSGQYRIVSEESLHSPKDIGKMASTKGLIPQQGNQKKNKQVYYPFASGGGISRSG